MFLIERSIFNYFFWPVVLLLFIWFWPRLLKKIFPWEFLDHPVINLDLSFLFLAFLGLVTLLLKHFSFYWSFLIFGVLFSVKYFFFQKYRSLFPKITVEDSKIIFCLLLVAILVLSFSLLVHDSLFIRDPLFVERQLSPEKDLAGHYLNYEGDYIISLNSAGRYLADKEALKEKILDIYNVTDRTPLFYFVLLFLLKTFGWNFFNFQMISLVFSVLYLAPTYLLAREYLKRPAATCCCLVLAFSQAFLFISIYQPSKMITLFFIIFAIWLIKRLWQKNIYLAAGLSSLLFSQAYFSHQYSLIYFGTGLITVLFLIAKRFKKKNLAAIVFYLTPFLLTIFLWARFVNLVGTPNLITQNMMFRNTWEEAGTAIKLNQKVTIFQAINFVRSQDFWQNKYNNILGLFIFNPVPGIIRLFNFNDITLPGVFGWILSFFLIWAFLKIRVASFKIIFFFLILIPLATVFYHGFYIRIGLILYLVGIIPLAMIYAFYFLQTSFKTKKSMFLVTFLIILENIFVHWTKSRLESFQRLKEFWLWNPMVLFWFMLIIILLSYYLLELAWIGKKDDKLSLRK